MSQADRKFATIHPISRAISSSSSSPVGKRCDHEFAPVILDAEGRHVAVEAQRHVRGIVSESDLQCRKCGEWLSWSA
jgi:hypothetical protein